MRQPLINNDLCRSKYQKRFFLTEVYPGLQKPGSTTYQLSLQSTQPEILFILSSRRQPW